MSEPLKILGALGDELDRATRADEARAHRRRAAWLRIPRGPFLILLAGLSITGVAAAATHVFGLAGSVPAPHAGDLPREARPLPSTVVYAGIPTKDPDGLPPWEVRVSRSATGELCTAVGQLQNGRFGIVGLDRRFRQLPLGTADACGMPPTGPRVQIGARAALGSGDMSARTLVVGIAGPDVSRIVLDGESNRPIDVPIGRKRAFVVVLKGLPDEVRPRVVVYSRSPGSLRTRGRMIALADNRVDEAPDPHHAISWQFPSGPAADFVHLKARGARLPAKGTRCVQATRNVDPARAGVESSFYDRPQTPIVCWPHSKALVVADFRRLVPSTQRMSPFFYGMSDARTVVVGYAPKTVQSVQISGGPYYDKPYATVSPRTGAFVAFFDGHTDPTKLRVEALLSSGRRVRVAKSTGTLIAPNGRPYVLPRAPAWIDAASVRERDGDGTHTTKVPASDALSPGTKDPAGGPAWAAHTWLAHGVQRATSTYICGQFGPVVNGTVRVPYGSKAGSAIPAESLSTICTPSAPGPRRFGVQDPRGGPVWFSLEPAVYVDDPNAATPHIARVVLSGVFPGARSATVLRNGKATRFAATVGPEGSVLALLPPAFARPSTILSLRVKFSDGRVQTTPQLDFSPPASKPVARAVDPNGGAPWAVQALDSKSPQAPTQPGQLIDGRLANVDPSTGFLRFGYRATGAPGFRDRAHPLWFAQAPTLRAVSPAPSAEQVARRTLPGRTVIYGVAAKGVRTVTLRTPRDVRTVRPSASGGLFLVVYDGLFTQGRITVTANGPGIHAVLQRPAAFD